MRALLTIAMMASSSLALAAAPALQSGAVNPPATLVHDGQRSTLSARQPVAAGDEVRTGSGGSAELYFVRDSLMTLGANSALFIHSSEAAIAGKGPILRVQLLQGQLKLDAYPPAQALAHDYRLNLGPMRARALGADLWASVTPAATTLCLLHGAIEITGAAGDQRLDGAGDCAQTSDDASAITLLPEAANRLMAASREVTPDHPVTAAATPAIADHQQQRWTVVLASMLDQSSAERAAQQLRRPGQPVSVIAVDSPRVYRVVSGQYDSRAAALQAAQSLRRDHGADDFWPTTLP